MARPRKTGIDTFPFDCGFFEDERVAAVAGEFGLKGEAVVVRLLCAIYRQGYFMRWDERAKRAMSASVRGVGLGLLDCIVEKLFAVGFFDASLREEGILTSEAIQRTYFAATWHRNYMRRGEKEALPYLLLSERDGKAGVIDVKNGVIDVKNGVIDVKNSKRRQEKESSKEKEREEKNPTTVVVGKEKAAQPPSTTTTTTSTATPTVKAFGAYAPYGLTVAEEVERMAGDAVWLDNLQVKFHAPAAALRGRLPEFRLDCECNGMERHESLQDAKRHFVSWLLKKNELTRKDYGKDKDGDKRDRRRGHILAADENERKVYTGTF